MKQQYKSLRWSAAIMFATVLLSGCSTVSDVASSSVSALSGLNPFSSDKEVSPASDAVFAPATPPEAIRVEAPQQEPVQLAAMPAPAAPTVQATVAGNTQCTTFCALPMHKSQPQ